MADRGAPAGSPEAMARNRDDGKRTAIKQAAKTLFATRGFAKASISDLVRATGYPVGTIYTYFAGKEDIVRAIVEEGWADLRERLKDYIDSQDDPRRIIYGIVEGFLPELLEDVDFINILLSEAIEHTRLEQKIAELTAILSDLVRRVSPAVDSKRVEVGLLIYFLGLMSAARIARTTKADVAMSDILAFVSDGVDAALGLSAGEEGGARGPNRQAAGAGSPPANEDRPLPDGGPKPP